MDREYYYDDGTGDWYYLSDGAIVGVVLAGIILFIIVPILCCCCCGWCCFSGRRNKNSHQVQIYQPPQTAASAVSAGSATAHVNVVSHNSAVASSSPQQWNYPTGPQYGQGQFNSGYVGQHKPQYYPEPRYYPQQQFGQYPSQQYQQGHYVQGQDNRAPRNYLGQSAYDIYEPKRPQPAPPKFPRPRMS